MPISAHSRLLDFARPTHVCDKEDLHLVRRLCEVSKQWLKINAQTWLACRKDVPVLEQYGSDCTPVQTRKHYLGE